MGQQVSLGNFRLGLYPALVEILFGQLPGGVRVYGFRQLFKAD